MKILIDLQSCQGASAIRGIGRYSLSLAKALIRQAGSEHQIHILLNSSEEKHLPDIYQALQQLLPTENIHIFHTLPNVKANEEDNAWRAKASELIREYYIASLAVDVVLVTSLFEGFIDDMVVSVGVVPSKALHAVVLYDLIPLLDSENYLPTPKDQQWYQGKLASLQSTDLLFAISDYTKLQAQERLGIEPAKIYNIAGAADDIFSDEDTAASPPHEIITKFGIQRPFVLFTGNLDSRKNISGMIEAYSLLPQSLRKAHQLVIVCWQNAQTLAHFANITASHGLQSSEVIFAGRVSDPELVALYQQCKIFVFPSLYEGFGLPVLEAMKCGAAVICSNTTSMPEVMGNQDALFDPYDPKAIAAKLAEALTDEQFLQALREHAPAQAARFSWDAVGRQVLECLEQRQNDMPGNAGGYENLFLADSPRYGELLETVASISTSIAPTKQDVREASLAIYRNSVEIKLNQQRTGRKNKLFVDVSNLARVDAKTGIQRVVRSLVHQLIHNPPPGYSVHPVYGINGQYYYANDFMCRFLNIKPAGRSDSPIKYFSHDILLGLDLNVINVAQQMESYLHAMRQNGVWIYYVIYDVLPLLHPEWFPEGLFPAFQNWMRTISSQSHGVVCISRSVAAEVHEYLRQHGLLRQDDPLQVKYFHLGADIENSLPSDGLPADAEHIFQQMDRRPTLLMVGTVEIRKGHVQALSALEKLWQRGMDLNLIIVGNPGWRVEELIQRLGSHAEKNQRLFWLQSCSDEMLDNLYRRSTALLAASKGEGFGLPLIEAAQKQRAIIARDIPVFREVAGEHAFYFHADTPEGLAQAIQEWHNLFSQSLAPTSAEMPWLTWAESTQQLLTAALPPQPKPLFIDLSQLADHERFLTPEHLRPFQEAIQELVDKMGNSHQYRLAFVRKGENGKFHHAGDDLHRFFPCLDESLAQLPEGNDDILALQLSDFLLNYVEERKTAEEQAKLALLTTGARKVYFDLQKAANTSKSKVTQR